LTLEVIDENGKIVDEDNPIIVEHNGSTGGETTLNLTLANSSAINYYRNVYLGVNFVPPVITALYIVGETVPNFMNRKRIPYIPARGRVPFQLRTSVPPNTSERIVRGITLTTAGTRYPLP
jgi:hypothetical protein